MSTANVKTFFDGVAEEYNNKNYAAQRRTFMSVRLTKVTGIIDALYLPTGSMVLDAGCGPGILTTYLCKKNWNVCAVDISEEMLRIAKASVDELFDVAIPSFKVGGIEQLPYADNTFDLVCSIGVIEYLPSYHKAIVEFYRVLKPGGKLVLSTTSNRSPAHYLKPLVEYGKKIPYIAKKFNTKFRNFSVALHHIPTFKRDVLDVGFWFREEVYFFMLLYPRPFNLLFPKLSEKLEKYLDKFTNTALKHLAEGYIIVGKK